MQGLREIKRRIRSVKSTQQITRAMKMVAAARLRKAQERVLAARPYARKMKEVFMDLLANSNRKLDDPLFQTRPVKKVGYVIITADGGMCGGYNANIMRRVLHHVEDWERMHAAELQERLEDAEIDETPVEEVPMEEGGQPLMTGAAVPDSEKEQTEFLFIPVGKKGRDFLQFRGYNIVREFVPMGNEPNVVLAREISRQVSEMFKNGDLDEVYLVYSQFITAMTQRPVAVKLLPLEDPKRSKKDATGETAERTGEVGETQQQYIERGEGQGRWLLPEYIFEPSPELVLGRLVPRYIETQIYQALLEGKAGEFGARMTAMDSATKNAGEVLGRLTLFYNRARQANITKEITEVVGGAEALK